MEIHRYEWSQDGVQIVGIQGAPMRRTPSSSSKLDVDVDPDMILQRRFHDGPFLCSGITIWKARTRLYIAPSTLVCTETCRRFQVSFVSAEV